VETPEVNTATSRAGSWLAAPVVVSVLCMVIWGASPIATRVATEDMEPLVVAVLRTVLAALVAVPLVAAGGLRPPANRHSRLLLAVSAASAFVVFPVVYTIGQDRTSAMHGVAILAGLPVFTGLWAALVMRRLPNAWWLAGCALALVGEAVIIAVRDTGGGDDTATLTGDLIVLGAALAVSSGYIAGALLVPRGVPSATTTYWGVILGAIVLAPLGIGLAAGGEVPHGDLESWGALLFLAVMVSIVGYVGWYWALARGGMMRMAPLMFLQPISGLVLAALILGERLSLALVVGAAFVLGGVAVARRG
jgi:drug/metabolite transporter (DMT)-like permease